MSGRIDDELVGLLLNNALESVPAMDHGADEKSSRMARDAAGLAVRDFHQRVRMVLAELH
jgi:hypothetical protein